MADMSGQMLEPALFYGDEVTAELLKRIDEHLNHRHELRLQALKLRTDAMRLRARAAGEMTQDGPEQSEYEELLRLFKSSPREEPPPGDAIRPFSPIAIPTVRSCISLDGPYIQWRREQLSTGGALFHNSLLPPDVGSTVVETDSPRQVDAQEVIGGGEGTTAQLTVGATSLVRLMSDGPATLTAEIIINAHDNIFSFLVGDAEGRLTLGGIVNRVFHLGDVWVGRRPFPLIVEVPVGTSETTLDDLHYIGFASRELESHTIQVTFPGARGAVYACSAFVQVFAMAVLASVANVEIAANINPLEVCQ